MPGDSKKTPASHRHAAPRFAHADPSAHAARFAVKIGNEETPLLPFPAFLISR